MSSRYRKTYAEINLKNILYNYKKVQELNPTVRVAPVIKANAYGHGATKVMEYLFKNGVTFFIVSLLEEALELRKINAEIDILVMGVLDNEGFAVCDQENIIATVSDENQLTSKKFKNLKVHLKVDTGMNRLGFKSIHSIREIITDLESKNVTIDGIYTHFATADCDKEYYDGQLEKFYHILSSLNRHFKYIHVSNSSSAIKYESFIDHTTLSRLGISLYGLTLDQETTFLKPAFKLKTKISSIKRLSKGESLGYGATYTAKKDELIGVLPIGYADGIIRKNAGGDVEINGKRYQIVGRICMDQLFVLIDGSVTCEDDVILFGGMVTIDEVATRLETINYEVVCQITNRVPRVYIE